MKWKKRPSVQEKRTGPREPRSTVLTPEEEAIIVASRRPTLLLLNDCPYALERRAFRRRLDRQSSRREGAQTARRLRRVPRRVVGLL